MNIQTLGVDLGKHGCHIAGQDAKGNLVERKQLSNKQFAIYLSKLPKCNIYMEACGGAHYWARKAISYGHACKLIPAKFVKPFVKSNKNDWVDAEAICEAGQRPNMRFAHVRSEEQQALAALLKLRDGLVVERTACINRGHAFLLEFGIPVKRGRGFIDRLSSIAADLDYDIPMALRFVLNEVCEQYRTIQEQVQRMENQLKQLIDASDAGKRLLTIPGVGIMTAGYVLAWVGDGRQFRSGRQFSAWAGLVPRQYSTGGKTTLLGISKRGSNGLRKLLIHGARSSIQWKLEGGHAWSGWMKELLTRKPKPVAIVAMANKLARIIWAVLVGEQPYKVNIAR
ncbi:IS110 family transposase [Aestuariirhabdus sp. Z084]|uniref:IS110 family transposase n=1 Tax=Aestuariirhabdus haliotis TaxID=2918751 RepID=UPI00201B3778|nr:IS110 family transposase [Aestuariirhabdus haliotis]MCL6417889.1 IS110 family transposase [Aestuariirhabdus haliotis]MCL6421757.1 IS110 family transposase [Aestuariirhabdus haliotis]